MTQESENVDASALGKKKQLKESFLDNLDQANATKEQKRLLLMINKRKVKEEQLQKDTAESGDPFVRYGFGLIAYRNTLFNLMMAFVVFSLLAWPMAATYSSGTAWKEGFSTYGKYTLGNLGYNTA